MLNAQEAFALAVQNYISDWCIDKEVDKLITTSKNGNDYVIRKLTDSSDLALALTIADPTLPIEEQYSALVLIDALDTEFVNEHLVIEVCTVSGYPLDGNEAVEKENIQAIIPRAEFSLSRSSAARFPSKSPALIAHRIIASMREAFSLTTMELREVQSIQARLPLAGRP